MMAISIINVLPTQVLAWKCPHEVLYKQKPNYEKFHIFGSLFYYKILPSLAKLEARAHRSIFLGFTLGKKGFKLYDLEAHKLITSRDIEFFEEIFPYKENKKLLPIIETTDQAVQDTHIQQESPSYSKSEGNS